MSEIMDHAEWLAKYMPRMFDQPFDAQQRHAARTIGLALEGPPGTHNVVRLSRGGGASVITIGMIVRAICTGPPRFVVTVSCDSFSARCIRDQVLYELEHNERITDAFPAWRRTRYHLRPPRPRYRGPSNSLAFPCAEGSTEPGTIVTFCSWHHSFKGLHAGGVRRPDAVILDNPFPDGPWTAAGEARICDVVEQRIAFLGGIDKPVSIAELVTERPDCLRSVNGEAGRER